MRKLAWSKYYRAARLALGVISILIVGACDEAITEGTAPWRVPRAASHTVIAGTGNRVGVNLTGILWLPNVRHAVIDSLADANIGWVRLGIGWSAIQPNSSTDWNAPTMAAALDIARYAAIRGVNVLINIAFYTPSWANGSSPLGECAPVTAMHYPDYRSFIARLVQEFDDSAGVKYYSIGNEPDDPSQFCPGSAWLPAYTALLRMGADQIKSRSNQLKVIGYELSGLALTDTTLDQVEDSLVSLGSLVDILGVHSYGRAQDIMDRVDGDMKTRLPGREIWLTETGLRDCCTDARVVRDQIFLLLSKFLHDGSTPESTYKTNTSWTKVFYWRAVSETNNNLDSVSLFKQAYLDDPAQLQPTRAFYGIKYLATTYYQNTGAPSVTYSAYHYNGPSYDPAAWVTQTDAWSIGASGWELWSIYFKLHDAAERAGMHICYAEDFGYIVQTLTSCDGATIGPFQYDAYPHYVQQLRVWTDTIDSLPGPASDDRRGSDPDPWASFVPIRACVQLYFPGYGWRAPSGGTCSQQTISKPSSTTWAERIGFYLDGDLR